MMPSMVTSMTNASWATGSGLLCSSVLVWDVYGVPETFVVAKDGHIAHKHIGPLTPNDLEETILPLFRRLRQQ